MSKRAGWSWWASLGFGRRSARDANDFGDMGTAFGLDASLGTLPLPAPGGEGGGDKSRPPSSGTGPVKKR